MKPLILASTSRYRAELLRKLGLEFATRAPDVDESPHPDESATALVRRLAEAKARAVAAVSGPALVIGSDQVAVCAERILGKPGTPPRAEAQLAELSGRKVRFLTGLCLLDTETGRCRTAVDTTTVTFRRLSAVEITNYVAREMPLDCAGSFKSEGLGIALFEAIEGKDPNALIGLPLIELCHMLREAGVDVLG
jgi:septum formation protein